MNKGSLVCIVVSTLMRNVSSLKW